ncbi:MAG TPA: tRNA lysidine(34) synthetase TilS [Opitutales bacterium]|nr:tRNA lysidine(34) synthetase TilS [Opitutales bacterium]
MKKPAAQPWSKIAAHVGDTFPPERLVAKVRGWLELNSRADEPWAVAVSGGADSVGLLLLLWEHFPKQRKKILVLHFDHATRPDSATDARFVEKLAKDLGARFATSRRASGGPASEAVLREARWKFFREQLAAHQARLIFLGHQRDDIAETMLMRLARGSGAAGLCVPRPVQDHQGGIFVLRPLLDIPRHQLRMALESAGATWREDSSNAEDYYLRNRIRKQVIPVWRQVLGDRDLDNGVARSRAALEDDDDALCALTDTVYGELAVGEPLPLARFASQPPAVIRRALWRWLNENGVKDNLNANAMHALLIAVLHHHPGRWSAGPGRWLVLGEAVLSLSGGESADLANWKPVAFVPGATIDLPGGAHLKTRVVAVDKKLLAALKLGRVNPATSAWLALPKSVKAAKFFARPWQPGDRYRPLGAPGSRKLQDLFTDKKIPQKERRLLPVVCSGDNLPLWAPGLPPAHAWRVTTAAQSALELTYGPR